MIYFNPHQNFFLFDAVEQKLQKMKLDIDRIFFLMTKITPSKRTKLFYLFTNMFIRLVQSTLHFKNIYPFLKAKEQAIFYTLILPKLIKMTTNIEAFKNLFILPLAHLIGIYQRLPETFFEKLTLRDWSLILKRMIGAHPIIENHLVKYIIPLINNAIDYESIARHLTEEHQKLVFHRKKRNLIGFIKKAHYFQMIFPYLPPSERNDTFERLRPKLPYLLREIKNLSSILRWATLKECKAIAKIIKNSLSHIIAKQDN